ncbi:MAG: hypothetical protein ACP5I8_14250 [Phycisphaerae bacterium]
MKRDPHTMQVVGIATTKIILHWTLARTYHASGGGEIPQARGRYR